MFTRGFPHCFLVNFGQNAVTASFSFILGEQAKHVAHTLNEARKRGATVVEPSAKAVEDYVAEVKPLSFSQQTFWIECTPSRSEEHTSELQSLMRPSYAVFCLKKQQ